MPRFTFSPTVIENIQAEGKAIIIAMVEIIFNKSKVHFGFLAFMNKKMRIQAKSPRENKMVTINAIFLDVFAVYYNYVLL